METTAVKIHVFIEVDRHKQEKRDVPFDAFLQCLADDVNQRRRMPYNVNELSF